MALVRLGMPVLGHVRAAVLGVALAVALAVAGCGEFPRDPEGTLDRVRGGVLRVGVTEHDPWVRLDGGEPSGVEVTLVKRFAAQLGAHIHWVSGSEAELMDAIRYRELDIVVGGLDTKTTWQRDAALTRPYVVTHVEVAMPRGGRVPEDIAGMRVAVEAGSEAAGQLAKTDAIPVLVDDPTKVDPAQVDAGLVVVHDFELEHLGLQPIDVTLKRVDHVMAVPLGENAFMTHLERYLLGRPDEVRAVLDREARR